MLCGVCFCELYGDHRDLHLLTHSFPTRRSSDLWCGAVPSNCDAAAQPRPSGAAEGFVRPRIDRCGTRETFEPRPDFIRRSEEHTSELQSLMRISYAVLCLKKKHNETLLQSSRRTCLHQDTTPQNNNYHHT